MISRKRYLPASAVAVATIAAVAVVTCGFRPMGAQQAQATEPPQRGNPRLDVGKGRVERPTEQVVRATAAAPSDNPKVEPGLVHWHATFQAARDAARKSSKPVLLFHMMGKLDDQFC